jgi:hypothetical protein
VAVVELRKPGWTSKCSSKIILTKYGLSCTIVIIKPVIGIETIVA